MDVVENFIRFSVV